MLDVREPHEWYISHLDFARLIPKGDLPDHLNEFDQTKEYVLHCKSGVRSLEAARLMKSAGLPREEPAGRHQCVGAGDRSEFAAVLSPEEIPGSMKKRGCRNRHPPFLFLSAVPARSARMTSRTDCGI